MRKGFTLVELLLFTAIFSMVMIGIITVLVSVTGVETRQLTAAEVEQQSQFLLQQFQFYIAGASNIDVPQDVATSTLTLRMANAASDPTIITLSNGVVYLQQGTGATAQPLTSSQVKVTSLAFIKRANPPAHDAVSINFTVANNVGNTLQQKFSQAFQTTIARVSAATFDSPLLPSSTNTYSLGATTNAWTNINGYIFFDNVNSRMGVNQPSPGQTLEVGGGVQVNSTVAQPSCVSANRGTFWVVQGAGGVKDGVQVCAKDAADLYAWRTIY